MFKFCHDNVCQHWTERSTLQLVVARKDSFRACVADNFARCRFLEFGFDKFLIVDSIYNDFQCPLEMNIRKERFHIKRHEFITFGEQILIDRFTTNAQKRASDHLANDTSRNNQHPTIWLTIPFVGDLSRQLVKKLKRKLRRCLVDPNVDIRIKEKTTKLCFFTSTKDKTPQLSQSNVVYEFIRALVVILRTSAKRTELCLSEHKNMHSRTKKALYINIFAIVIISNTYKIYTTYRIFLLMRTFHLLL